MEKQERPPNVALLAVILVLAAFGTLATTLYLRGTGTRADRSIAAGTPQLPGRTVELAVVRWRLNTAQAQLDGMRDVVTLDPKVYEAIKKCVQQAAPPQRSDDRPNGFLEYPTAPLPAPPTGPIGGPPGDADPVDPAICSMAATYLK